MALKWNKKMVIEHITQLKSPFDDLKPTNGSANPQLQRIIQRKPKLPGQ